MESPLLEQRPEGLYCATGDFYIDPGQPVARAVITHAHGDHARRGSQRYLTAQPGGRLLRKRMGPDAIVETLSYGVSQTLGDVRLSFHPAGHLLGSAQIRLERGGEVWVASSDYKRGPDATCAPFEVQRCHTFLTESTFALPIYRWPDPHQVFAEMNTWWRLNQTLGLTSLLFVYALGKAQHVLSGIDASIGPILTHGAINALNDIYRQEGVMLPPTLPAEIVNAKNTKGKALILAPPSVQNTPSGSQVPTFLDGVRLRMDVDPRRAPPAGAGPGVCTLRSR